MSLPRSLELTCSGPAPALSACPLPLPLPLVWPSAETRGVTFRDDVPGATHYVSGCATQVAHALRGCGEVVVALAGEGGTVTAAVADAGPDGRVRLVLAAAGRDGQVGGDRATELPWHRLPMMAAAKLMTGCGGWLCAAPGADRGLELVLPVAPHRPVLGVLE